MPTKPPQYNRYQKGLTMNMLFPAKSGVCACGCNSILPQNRKKWFSNECRNSAYIQFATIKGDNAIIRHALFEIDEGYCRNCGVFTEDWQADHILSVVNGGGASDISNFQTLCLGCHKEKTKSLLIITPSL